MSRKGIPLDTQKDRADRLESQLRACQAQGEAELVNAWNAYSGQQAAIEHCDARIHKLEAKLAAAREAIEHTLRAANPPSTMTGPEVYEHISGILREALLPTPKETD